jgi:hypothetical protein
MNESAFPDTDEQVSFREVESTLPVTRVDEAVETGLGNAVENAHVTTNETDEGDRR